jgi:hypothetical protein
LQRRGEDVGASPGKEVVRERQDEPSGHRPAVFPSVQREVVPAIRIPLVGLRREIGRVRDDPVEPSQPPGEVRPNGDEVEALPASDRRQPTHGVRVEVGRSDPCPPMGGGQRERARAGADLEERRPGVDRRER